MRICIIFNPAARGEKAQRLRHHLTALSAQAALKPTHAPGAARALAAEAVREGFTTIVAAGGDGTLNEVVNGLGDVAEGLARTRLGVLPLGTVNVFARELALPKSFAGAWAVIQAGRERVIDLPATECIAAGQPQRRFFAQFGGAGFDSRAVELVDLKLKKRIGPLAYVVAGCRALREPQARILASSACAREEGELVLIGNGRYYGGSFNLFPQANLGDGLLDVTVFPRVNWTVVWRTGWGWLMNRLHATAGCRTFQTASVTLTSNRPVTFELDGENSGQLPVTFTVQRQALRVLVP